jgi:hypothetical protein
MTTQILNYHALTKVMTAGYVAIVTMSSPLVVKGQKDYKTPINLVLDLVMEKSWCVIKNNG